MPGTIYHLNGDFDLSLRRRPLTMRRRATVETVRALGVHWLLAGRGGDALLTDAGIPEEYLDYLRRQGFDPPRTLRFPDVDRDLRYRPLGWNAEAMRINGEQHRPEPHPGLETVRSVNSRTFAFELEREDLGERAPSASFSNLESLEEWVGRREEPPGGWVVKSEHGNAGIGNRRLEPGGPSAADRRFIGALLAEGDLVFIEAWRRRLKDLCAVFNLDRAGRIEGLRWHETVNTSSGSLIGAVFDPCAGEMPRPVSRAAALLARELSRRSYFGPVCFDAFAYEEEGTEGMRPLVDLNCRRPMSDAIHRLWRSVMADRVLYWRFFSTRRLRRDFAAETMQGRGAYRPGKPSGTLIASPWNIELHGRTTRAPKTALAFIGEKKDDVMRLEEHFRYRFER